MNPSLKNTSYFFLIICVGYFYFGLLSDCLYAQSYLDATLPTEERVADLLSRMTLQEKVGQLNQLNGIVEFTGPAPSTGSAKEQYELLKAGKVGTMLNVIGAEATLQAQRVVMEHSRLKIPLAFAYDVIHGYKTIFPIPLAEAASWDLNAIEKSARIAAIEASAAGLHWTFAPMMDVGRDPRWGRVMEGAGEDPHLGSKVAVARIQGFQGDDLSNMHTIAATAKHFAGYGFSEAGRDYATVEISDNTLHNVVLPPFKAAAEVGIATFMNGFNDFNGVPVTANSYLQRDLLKGKWGFEGVIVSDWASIEEMRTHGYTPDMEHAAKAAILAGNDLDMESKAYINHLQSLVESGEVPMDVLDEAVSRLLKLKFELGLFENPYAYSDVEREKQILYNEEHLEAARDVARKSIVLLKNENALLPLDFSKKQKIAVIGALANDKDTPLGNWRGQGVPNSAVSLLEGIQAAVSNEVEVAYAKGYELAVGDRLFYKELTFAKDDGSLIPEAVELAKSADVVLLAVGEEALQSGEARSKMDISLKGRQLEVFKRIQEANPNTVVMIMSGRPIIEPELYENASTVLQTWHLGSQAGHAIADILSGAYNPSGKLPMTIPAHTGQIPIYYYQKNTGRPAPKDGNYESVFWSHYIDGPNEPQYPFGYGLSYTQFELVTPSLDKNSYKMGDSIKIEVSLRNTGKRFGEEVVQLYLRDHHASLIRPIKELKGFQKIGLEPGETTTVRFELSTKELGFYNVDGEWIVEAGAFTVMVGDRSDELQEVRISLE